MCVHPFSEVVYLKGFPTPRNQGKFIAIIWAHVLCFCFNNNQNVFLLVTVTRREYNNICTPGTIPDFYREVDMNILPIISVFFNQAASNTLTYMFLLSIVSEYIVMNVATYLASRY